MTAPWGDWLNVNDPTPHAYVDLCYFAKICRQMTEMADAQDLKAEADRYREWLAMLRRNFRSKHLQQDGSITPSSQSAYVLALDSGLLTEPAERRTASTHLANLLTSKADAENTGMTTGFLGTKPLLPVLTDTGTRAYCTMLDSDEETYSVMVEGSVDKIELGDIDDPLVYFRGRYRPLD